MAKIIAENNNIWSDQEIKKLIYEYFQPGKFFLCKPNKTLLIFILKITGPHIQMYVFNGNDNDNVWYVSFNIKTTEQFKWWQKNLCTL